MNRKIVILVVVAVVAVAGVAGYLFLLGPGGLLGPQVSVSLESVSVGTDEVVATFTIRNPLASPIFLEDMFAWIVSEGVVSASSPRPVAFVACSTGGSTYLEVGPGQSGSVDLAYPINDPTNAGFHNDSRRFTSEELQTLSSWRPQGVATFTIDSCERIMEDRRPVNLFVLVIEGTDSECEVAQPGAYYCTQPVPGATSVSPRG